MDSQLDRRFLRQLRDRMGEVLAATQPLAALVQEQGGQADRQYLALMNKSLYRLLRDIHHAEVCVDEPIFQPHSLDIAGLCRDLGREMELLAKALGVKFDWSLDKASLITVGDDQLLQMAILNLLTNAIEAAGPGGCLALRLSCTDKRWSVTVEDDGPGLRYNEPEPGPLQPQRGVGLGLDTVQKVAQLHGGTFLTSNDNGLRAVLSAPIIKPGSPEDTSAQLHSPAPIDHWGGFSPVLVELSPVLPAGLYDRIDP